MPGCRGLRAQKSTLMPLTPRASAPAVEVERGTREHEELIDLREATEFDLPESGNRFEPGEVALDSGPARLAHGIARMSGRDVAERTSGISEGSQNFAQGLTS